MQYLRVSESWAIQRYLLIGAAVKTAIDKAATEDRRSTASIVEKVLAGWAKANGYLKKWALADIEREKPGTMAGLFDTPSAPGVGIRLKIGR
jgi:hypothetical protein